MKKVLVSLFVAFAIIGVFSVFCFAKSPDVVETEQPATEQATEQPATEQATEQPATETPQITVASASEPAVTLTTYESEPMEIEYLMLISAGTDTVQIATVGWNMFSTDQKNDIIGITKPYAPGTSVKVGHRVTKITKVTLITEIPTTKKGYDKQMLVEYEFEAKNLGVTTTGTNRIMVKYDPEITRATTIQDDMNRQSCCLRFGGNIQCPSKSTGNCAPCGDATPGERQCDGIATQKTTNSQSTLTRAPRNTATAGNGSNSPRQ